MMSCDDAYVPLKIENKTTKPVYYVYSKGYTLNNLDRIYLFRDTINHLDTLYENLLSPNSITTINGPFRWEGYVETTPGDKINFFFFSRDTLSMYSWDEIAKKNLYTAMGSYSIDDLNKMGWKITYPIKNYKPPIKSLKTKGKKWLDINTSLKN